MSEHQECYPLPVNCNMGKGRIEFADGKLLCTMPPTCVNESWEYKRDLILNSVNNYDRLRKANEELVKTLNNIITAVVHFKVKAEWCAEVADQVLKEVQEILNHSHESSESDE